MSHMSDTDTYTTVSIARKLIAKKTDKLHDILRERANSLNAELDSIEAEFAKGIVSDELELQKLNQYRTSTIELFNAGDKQLAKIEDKIYIVKKSLDNRKVMLEWDDSAITKQLAILGSIVRKENTDGQGYEWLDGDIENEDESNTIHYEQIDEDFMSEVNKEIAYNSHSAFQTEEPVVKSPGFKPGEYLRPHRDAPLPPSSLRRPPPPPVPVPPLRSATKPSLTARSVMKSWRSKSFDESSDPDTGSTPPEPDLYSKVPDGTHGLGALRKKSNSLGGKLNLLGTTSQLEYKVAAKCRIGSGPGQILRPKNIAISDKTGCIFVAEKGNNRVQVFAGSGDPMYSITHKSGGTGHAMIKPYGVCVLAERVYVSVSQFCCIQVYKTNGEFLMERGGEGKGEGQFVFPTGMNTDGNTRVYACDYGNNRVQVFSKELHFKQLIGVGNLLNPTDIAVDKECDLFVVDRSTTIVHQFSYRGLYKRKLIKISMFPILSNPQYIAITPKGNLVLSDLLTNSVNIFSKEGQLRWTIGGPRDKDVFGEPRGIAFDRKGDLVVACHKEIGCLQILEMDI